MKSANKKSDLFSLSSYSYSKLYLILFAFSFLLYANTLNHEYTQDDAIVITQNEFTNQGISGIPKILGNDTFLGFFKSEEKLNLVSGGRYRPLSLILFSVEVQLFGLNPFYGHLINVILYALLVLMIFKSLNLVLNYAQLYDDATNKSLSFLIALAYSAHPVHTEVVANIKGGDEILAMLFSMISFYYSWKFLISSKTKDVLVALFALFLGLLSKENSISFVFIIPMSMLLFSDFSFKKITRKASLLLIPAVAFVLIRMNIVKSALSEVPNELMNNPFLKIVNGQYIHYNFSEKLASIIYTFGEYLRLLLFPHTLTHDYYPMQVGLKSWGNPEVILTIMVIATLLYLVFSKRKKWPLFTFSILYFAASIFLMSNLMFPVGTNMNERFLFMPSLGFSILTVLGFYKLYTKGNKNATIAIFTILIILYSAKTISRNRVWHDDYTLFTTDVEVSTNSAKCQNAAGGAILDKMDKNDQNIINSESLRAEGHLKKAVEIHPNYAAAHLLLGNALLYQGKHQEAIIEYETTLQLQPSNRDASSNLALAYRDYGKYLGEKKSDFSGAQNMLLKSYAMNPDDAETVRLLGVAYGVQNNHNKAVEYFEKLVKMQPNSQGAYKNLRNAYMGLGDEVNVNRVNDIIEKLK
ncbi:MAG TPA: tetratricopeptide repeat protein [Saprospiraceae bacterium]|nr:tetratricopeptide repeat protein [Saprospiraceae bacterium]HPQ20242.1 tetratricopeptide repeat protein [Saprospiraceae bacterium]